MPPNTTTTSTSTSDRGTANRGTSPSQRGTTSPWSGEKGLGVQGGVDYGGEWDLDSRTYWYYDQTTQRTNVWDDDKKAWVYSFGPEDAIKVEGTPPPQPKFENDLTRFSDGIGTRYGQTHGVFLGVGAAPIAMVEEPAVELGAQLGARASVVAGTLVDPAFMLGQPPLQRAAEDLGDARREWTRSQDELSRAAQQTILKDRGDLYQLPVTVAGTVRADGRPDPKVRDFVEKLTETYRNEVAKAKAASPDATPSQIGRKAEAATFDQVDELARSSGLDPGHISVGDFPAGTTGPKGGATTYDLGSIQYKFTIELKKSRGAVRGFQAEAQQVSADQSVNFPEGGTSYRIYGEGDDPIESVEMGGGLAP